MVRQVNELNGNTGKFAQHCAEQCSIIELVTSARNGIDYDKCYEWGITGEQWQDAIFAAMEELGKQS